MTVPEANQLSNTAMGLINAGRPKEAIPPLRQALEMDCINDLYWHNMGVAAEDTSQFELAIRCYRRAVQFSKGKNKDSAFNLKRLGGKR